jgi:uncharacterized coiled-coil DUF342 family protein
VLSLAQEIQEIQEIQELREQLATKDRIMREHGLTKDNFVPVVGRAV